MLCVVSLVIQSCPTLCNPLDCSQAPLSLEVFRQEYWNGLPFPPPGVLINSGIKPTSPWSPELAGGSLATAPPGKCKDLLVMAQGHLVAEYGIQFPDQELTQGPLHWKYGVEPPDHKRSSRIERFIERSKVYSPDYRVPSQSASRKGKASTPRVRTASRSPWCTTARPSCMADAPTGPA